MGKKVIKAKHWKWNVERRFHRFKCKTCAGVIC